MQWILVASVLNWQPVYADQETCQIAADELKKVYYQEVAACLPRPSQQNVNDNVDRMFEQFLGMVKELQKIEQKELDSTNK
jgi:hypothetical protein